MDSAWVEYTYDSLGQLLLEEYSSGSTIEYQYDQLGNRILMIKDGVNTVYSYNTEKNRLVSAGSNNYTYDANGNVIGDGTYTYAWGDDNRLKEVKQGTNTIATFTYDAIGRREEMTANSVTKKFHYDGDNVTYVTQSDGKVYRFAYDHGGKPIFMSYQNNQYWYHYDQHGNVIRMTNSNGDTIAKYKYDAWGNITYQWGTSGNGSEIVDLNPYRYAGYWFDSETGKYYLKARYYDAETGRFLAKDPITISIGDSLSLNAYTYGANNPVMFIDPSGLAAEAGTGGGGYYYSGKSSRIWFGLIPILHYDYRANKNKNAPKSIKDAKKEGYQLMSKEDSRYHQIGIGNENNKKYVSPDGHTEQVFHENGSIVTDPINIGTYNYFSPKEDPILHGVTDIAPYILLGNTPDDFWQIDIRLAISIDEGWKRVIKIFNK